MKSYGANKTKRVRSSSQSRILDSYNRSITSDHHESMEKINLEDARANETVSSKKTVADNQKNDDKSSRRTEKSKIVVASNSQEQGLNYGSCNDNKKMDKREKAARSAKSVMGIFSTKKVYQTLTNQASLSDSTKNISEKSNRKTDKFFTRTCEPVEIAGYVDKLPFLNQKKKLVGKAKDQKHSTPKHQNQDLSSGEKRVGRKRCCESVEDNSVLPSKIKKSQETFRHCVSSKKIQNMEKNGTAKSKLMQIDKIILSLPETSILLLRSWEQNNFKCPKCNKVFKHLKLGSIHYSLCSKMVKSTKNKKILVSPRDVVWVCSLCHSSFDETSKLSEHKKVCPLAKSSNFSLKSALDGKKYKCKKCCYECLSQIKFEEHPCDKNVKKMQLCSIQLSALDITQSIKSNLQCFECTRCCRLFLNVDSFNDHMKTAHNLKVQATESLKNITVHNPFCPPTEQIKVKNVPVDKETTKRRKDKKNRVDKKKTRQENGIEKEKTKQKIDKKNDIDEKMAIQRKEKNNGSDNSNNASFNIIDLIPDSIADVQEVIQFIENVALNGLQQDGENISINLDTNLYDINASNQTNSSEFQASGSVEFFSDPSNSSNIQAFGSVEMSKDQANSGSILSSGSFKMSNNQTKFSSDIRVSGSGKMSSDQTNFQAFGSLGTSYDKIDSSILRTAGSVEKSKNKTNSDNIREYESVRTSKDKTNFSNIQASRSLKMSNNQTNSSKIQVSGLEGTSESKTNSGNILASGSVGIISKNKTSFGNIRASGSRRMAKDKTNSCNIQASRICKCRGWPEPEEELKPCLQCLNESIIRNEAQTIKQKPDTLIDSGEKRCAISSESVKISNHPTNSSNIQSSGSVKLSNDQTNSSKVQASRFKKLVRAYRRMALKTRNFKRNEFSEDLERPFLKERICKCRGWPEPEKELKPCVECLNENIIRNEAQTIKKKSDTLNDSGEKRCAISSNSDKIFSHQTGSSNIESSRSVKMSNDQTNSSEIQAFRIEKIVQAYRQMALKTTECSENLEWPILKERRCKCRGWPNPEEDVKPCVECFNESIIRIADQKIRQKLDPLNFRGEERLGDNMDVDMAPKETLNSGPVIGTQLQSVVGDLSNLTTVPADNCFKNRAEECVEDNLDIDNASKKTINSGSVPGSPLRSVRDALLIPIYVSPSKRYNSRDEEFVEDNLDLVSQETLNSGLVHGSHFQTVKDVLSIPTAVSLKNCYNSKEQSAEDNLDIDHQETHKSGLVHDPQFLSAKDALSIPIYVSPNSRSREIECVDDHLDRAPQEILNSSLVQSVMDALPIPTATSPDNLYSSEKEQCAEDNLDIDHQETPNSGLVHDPQFLSAKDALPIPIYVSPNSHSREIECVDDHLDKAPQEILHSSLVQSVMDALPIPTAMYPSNLYISEKEQCTKAKLDIKMVPQESLNIDLDHGTQFQSLRDVFVIPTAVSPQNPCNSGEEDSAGDNLDKAPQETLNFDLDHGAQFSVPIPVNPGNDLEPSVYAEAEPSSVFNNCTESLRGNVYKDGPVLESIEDLSELITSDRVYESDDDFYACFSSRLQFVTRKLVVQREEQEPFDECVRIDSTQRWVAEEPGSMAQNAVNNDFGVDRLNVRHYRTSWGPLDVDAFSLIRSHNGENVLGYICNHCFKEFELDSLTAHLRSLYGKPANNEIKVAYNRDTLL